MLQYNLCDNFFATPENNYSVCFACVDLEDGVIEVLNTAGVVHGDELCSYYLSKLAC